MRIAIRDSRHSRSFSLSFRELTPFEYKGDLRELVADYVFVIPSPQFIKSVSVNSTPSNEGGDIAILDADAERVWLLGHADLENFSVTSDVACSADVWFSIPDDDGAIQTIPLFRKGLVQNIS